MKPKPVLLTRLTRRQIEDAVRLLNKYGHLSDHQKVINALRSVLDGQHHLVVEKDKKE
jgi:hypothetical protein